MMIQMILIFLCLLLSIVKFDPQDLSSENEILNSAMSTFGEIKEALKNKKTILSMFSYAFLQAAFFLQLLKWPHVTNQFNMTQNDAELMETYYVLGALFAVTVFSFFYQSYTNRPKLFFTICTIVGGLYMVLFILVILPSCGLALFTLSAFFIGCWIQFSLSFMMASVLNFVLNDTDNSNVYGTKVYALMLTLMGLAVAAAAIIGDYIHYMNRDIRTWIYAAEGIIGGLVILGYVLALFVSVK
mmetsp:Transcript_25623/g.24916  ORF Transcript_25623/g.24916 Transcript_25623/m.24916 type:complete len:243 (-) Transcript_25623:31-759(-)